MNLKGKTAVVLGGSRGIGKAISLRLAQEGVDIVLSYLKNHQAAQATKFEIEQMGRRAYLVPGNLNDPATIKTLFSDVKKVTPLIDMLIHSAALGTFRPLNEITTASWDLTMNVNARSFLLCAKEVKSLMGEKGGVIVGISSLGSVRYVPSYGAIGVSKAALESLIRYLAVELAPIRIRVNGVSGGPVETESLRSFPNFEHMKSECLEHTPENRLGLPQDIADVVVFLCSDLSRWIVGQTLIADGGLSLSAGYLK